MSFLNEEIVKIMIILINCFSFFQLLCLCELDERVNMTFLSLFYDAIYIQQAISLTKSEDSKRVNVLINVSLYPAKK